MHESVRGLTQIPRRIFQTLYRVVPYPVKPGLLVIGRPDRGSPVLVTTNYDLTVRRVRRDLEGLDCYLLVAPAGGLDVWCAAGGKRFTVESLLSVLKTTRIGERVDHRRLILPQLCATGINLAEVERRTGWSAVFGPAEAADVSAYLEAGRTDEAMSRVRFPPRQRLEMATAMWGSLSLRYGLYAGLFFGWIAAGELMLALAVFSLAVSLGCFVLPGKTFVQKAGILWLLAVAGLFGTAALGNPMAPTTAAQWTGFSAVAAFLVGTAFPSYSPFWQCGYSKLWYGYPDLKLAIVHEQCIGCSLCDQVCPVGCFSLTADRKMTFSRPERCEGCMACLLQCPTGAITNEVGKKR